MEKQLKFKVPWRVRSINIEGLLPQGGNRAKRLEVNFINPIELALDSLLSALDSGTPLLLESVVLRNDEGERVFGDLNTGLWWQDAQKRARELYNDETILLMPLIFYSDATLVSKTRKNKNETPIRCMLGSLPLELRMKVINMLFLGLVPHIPGAATGSNFCKVKVQGAAYDLIVEDIAKVQREPLVITHNGKTYKFAPVFGLNIADNEEADTWSLVRQVYTMGARCRQCAVGAGNMADLRDLEVLFKTKSGGKRQNVGTVKTLLLSTSEKLKADAIAKATQAKKQQYADEACGKKRRRIIVKSIMQEAGELLLEIGIYPFPHPMAKNGYHTFVNPNKLHIGYHSPTDRSHSWEKGVIELLFRKICDLLFAKTGLNSPQQRIQPILEELGVRGDTLTHAFAQIKDLHAVLIVFLRALHLSGIWQTGTNMQHRDSVVALFDQLLKIDILLNTKAPTESQLVDDFPFHFKELAKAGKALFGEDTWLVDIIKNSIKAHYVTHIPHNIMVFGCADGFDTCPPEGSHKSMRCIILNATSPKPDNDSSGTLQTGGLNAQLQHRHSLQYRFAALSALYGPLPQPTPDPVKIASQQSALRVDISAKTVFEQVHSVANRRPAVERNSRAQELRQLTGYQLRDIAIESMGGAAAGEVNLIKTYIAQTFTGADGSRLVVTHAVLDRACELSRLLERHIHACRVVKPDGCVEEVMLRLFSVVQCSGGNEGTQFGLLVQHLKPDPLASNESPQHPFEKHANHGFAVIPMNTVMSLTERYASVDPPPPASAASSSAAPARSVWVLPSRYKKSPHLRSSSGL